jgi:hypothetical protein
VVDTPRSMETPLKALFDRLLSAQIYVPTRDPEDFELIADTLNNHPRIDGRDIGIVFNAYNLKTGTAVLFGNQAARALFAQGKGHTSCDTVVRG